MGNEGSKINERARGKVSKGSLDNHLETASKTGALNLSRRKLDKIPPKLLTLCTNLRMLDLSYNNLLEISTLSNLKNLQKLNISNNKISDISYLLTITKLKSLDCSHNEIQQIPSLANSMKTLNISYNKVFQLHPEMFKNLDVLNLEANQLSVIPADFESKNLVELNVNNNKIGKLNSDSFVSCGRLKVLRVKNNKLMIDEFGSNFLKNSNVSTIEVDGNLFNEKAMKELDGFDDFEKRRTGMMMKKD